MYFRSQAVWKCLWDQGVMHGNHVSYMLHILVMVIIAELQVMLERSPSFYQQLKIVELLTLHTVL